MKELIQKCIKAIFGDTRQTIVSIVVAALVGGYTGLLYLSRTALEISLQLLSTQMPLWATTSLIVLCCLYTYVRVAKILSKSNQADQASKKPPVIKYFPIGNYKWKTIIYENDHFVDEYPYCIKHDLKFVFRRDSKYCPGTESEKCGYELRHSHFFEAYESAKSIIENKVRNKKY